MPGYIVGTGMRTICSSDVTTKSRYISIAIGLMSFEGTKGIDQGHSTRDLNGDWFTGA